MSLKFVEIGKVMLVWGILKNVSQVRQNYTNTNDADNNTNMQTITNTIEQTQLMQIQIQMYKHRWYKESSSCTRILSSCPPSPERYKVCPDSRKFLPVRLQTGSPSHLLQKSKWDGDPDQYDFRLISPPLEYVSHSTRLLRPNLTCLRAARLARSCRGSTCCISSPGSDSYPGWSCAKTHQEMKNKVLEKICRMFEAMAGNFAHPEEIQLFLNVLNGSLALHAGDSCIIRYP